MERVMGNRDLIAKALDLYEEGVPVVDITDATGLPKKMYAEFITPEIEKKRKESKSVLSSNWPEEWDKARFKLLGVKKE